MRKLNSPEPLCKISRFFNATTRSWPLLCMGLRLVIHWHKQHHLQSVNTNHKNQKSFSCEQAWTLIWSRKRNGWKLNLDLPMTKLMIIIQGSNEPIQSNLFPISWSLLHLNYQCCIARQTIILIISYFFYLSNHNNMNSKIYKLHWASRNMWKSWHCMVYLLLQDLTFVQKFKIQFYYD